MSKYWCSAALDFFRSLQDPQTGAFRSVPGAPTTLYGTCYASLGQYYLNSGEFLSEQTRRFIADCQDPKTGLMVGPELKDFTPAPEVAHDREHLLLHLTCAAIPVCRHFGIHLPFSVWDAHRFCDSSYLRNWLDKRNLENAWFEGNNILFVGQLLVYLRDVEKHPVAQQSIEVWFDWLDEHTDPKTSLWGTDGHCSEMEAVYGGYHQLLVYYHENHPIGNLRGLIDTVLKLQHADGGFNPHGNGGACEDVDCVDILVNCYKRIDYRRAEIRCALRQCLRHILALQNSDGGFPYNRNCRQSHMGIPGTHAKRNQSTAFASWFRIHTLALMAEILTDEPELDLPFRFTNNLSMGWHQTWDKIQHSITNNDRQLEITFERQWRQRRIAWLIKSRWNPFARAISLIRRVMARLRR